MLAAAAMLLPILFHQPWLTICPSSSYQCLQEAGAYVSDADFDALVPECSRAMVGTSSDFLLFDYNKLLSALEQDEGACGHVCVRSWVCVCPTVPASATLLSMLCCRRFSVMVHARESNECQLHLVARSMYANGCWGPLNH